MDTQIFDLPRVRGALAARRIPHKRLAEAAGLSPHYVYKILCGGSHGELARIKLARGLEQLGLESEVRHGAAS
jgi:hypothetical protein